MRPLRLTLTAFGPYADTEVVDFDALTELGLFVVAGNNGSGKTTIFDGLHYALFGTLPGSRSTYSRLKSDHASDAAECSVTLDFAAHGAKWRVTRSPKQQRPKRRGKGFTEAPAAATIFRLQGDVPIAETNRVEEVRAKCCELVGLTGKQFERVALLPQGQFSRVLSEGGTERRELLRTLFSSEIFGDATAMLSDQAAEATAADRTVVARLDHQRAALAKELRSLTGQELPDSEPALAAALADHRRVQLAALATTVGELHAALHHANQEHQRAVDIVERTARRADIERQLAQHAQSDTQHQRDLTRLRQARAAVPVASNVRTLGEQQDRLGTADKQVRELHQKLNHALSAAGLPTIAETEPATLDSTAGQIEALQTALAERAVASDLVNDLQMTTNRVHGAVRRLDNELSGLVENQALVETQRRHATTELQTFVDAGDVDQCERELRSCQAVLAQRIELAEIESRHTAMVRTATDHDAQIERLESACEVARQAQASFNLFQTKADAALAEFEECSRRHDAALRYQAASTTLTQARVDHRTACANADQIWDAFIAGTAARVAEALVEDEPCPVCGSAEHPEPATHDRDAPVATEAEVAAARAQGERSRAALTAVESEIEQLRRTNDDIASLVPTELAAHTTTAKAMALGARSAADQAQHQASQLDNAAGELAQLLTQRRHLGDELASLDQRRNRLHGALGESASDQVDVVQARVAHADHAHAHAKTAATRRAELGTTISQAEHELTTLSAAKIAADNRRAAAREQLHERLADLATATTRVDGIDAMLQDITSEQTVALGLFERQAKATRHALTLVAQAKTASALRSEAADSVRRAQSIADDRLAQSPFDSLQAAMDAFVEPSVLEQIEAQANAHSAAGQRLYGQLQAIGDLPQTTADVAELTAAKDQAAQAYDETNRALIAATTTLDRIEHELRAIAQERNQRQTSDSATRRLERVAALAKGDNDRNTSLENWVLAAHLRDVVDLANLRLARSTHQRFQLCVLDDGENKRGKWGLDLGVEDTVTGTRRPTAGLSGGELFQASLALALGLADAVMNQSAGVRIDALFIDEGFGSLDETSVERAIDLLDELRDRGAMVGVITHVPALLDALPLGVHVVDAGTGRGSTIRQSRSAA